MYKVVLCKTKNDWVDSFNELSISLNYFMDWDYNELLKSIDYIPLSLLIYCGAKLVGIYQAVVQNHKKFIVNLLNVRCGGREEGEGLFFSSSVTGNDKKEVLDQIIKKAKSELRSKYGIISIFHFSFYTCSANNLYSGFRQSFVTSPVIDMSLSVDSLWAGLNKKHRNEIRQAQKRNVEIRFSNSKQALSDYFILAKPYWKKLNRLYWLSNKERFFRYHMDSFNKGLASLFIAYVKEKPAAFALIWHNHGKMIYGDGGVDDNFRWNRPTNLLLWEVIKWGKNKGYNIFDMAGGTDDPNHPRYSISQFKMRFGAKLRRSLKYYKVYLL